MNRSESKYFATAKRMDEAFIQILEKKDYAYITVKEICNVAGVNRSTFYLHYETMDDLLNESADYIIHDFMEHMSASSDKFMDRISKCSPDDLYLITPQYLVPYLNYIKDNQRIFRTALMNVKVLKMDEAYERLLQHIISPILDRYGVFKDDRPYIMEFSINGLMAIIKLWLKNECVDSIEHVIKVMQQCIRKHKDI